MAMLYEMFATRSPDYGLEKIHGQEIVYENCEFENDQGVKTVTMKEKSQVFPFPLIS